jgi:hypothetical protein
MDSNALSQQIAALDAGYNPTQIYNDAMNTLGVPDARTRVTGLQKALTDNENLINNVDPSVTGRTQNSLVTEAQRSRLVSMEKQPLLTAHGKMGTDYGYATSNLGQLLGEATTRTGLATEAYKSKRESLAGLLAAAIQREQEAAAQRRWEQEQAERVREFNASQASRGGGGGGGGGGSGGGGGGSKGPTYQQRGGGGFNFQNAAGQPISARLYAQLTGTNFNTLLRQMAASGDSGAADVLKNGGSSKAYKALTWN